MRNSQIGEDTVLDKAIVAEDVVIGNKVTLGFGEEAANVLKPAVLCIWSGDSRRTECNS